MKRKVIIFIVVAVILMGGVGAIHFFFLPHTPHQTSITTISCNGFTLIPTETINLNFEAGNSVSLSVAYVKGDKKMSLPVSLGPFTQKGNDSIYADPVSLLEKMTFPVKTNGAIGSSSEPFHIVFIDPKEFSESEYESITECLAKNTEVIKNAYITHRGPLTNDELSKINGIEVVNIEPVEDMFNIYGTAYATEMDFLNQRARSFGAAY